tara:strand:+ start:671 stop:1045 length:375 start_codon:yes stop_codon:yes gene_type:complete
LYAQFALVAHSGVEQGAGGDRPRAAQLQQGLWRAVLHQFGKQLIAGDLAVGRGYRLLFDNPCLQLATCGKLLRVEPRQDRPGRGAGGRLQGRHQLILRDRLYQQLAAGWQRLRAAGRQGSAGAG